ncbi:MAG: hypothetical protein ACK559_07175, partial [bacterium]
LMLPAVSCKRLSHAAGCRDADGCFDPDGCCDAEGCCDAHGRREAYGCSKADGSGDADGFGEANGCCKVNRCDAAVSDECMAAALSVAPAGPLRRSCRPGPVRAVVAVCGAFSRRQDAAGHVPLPCPVAADRPWPPPLPC